MSKGYTLNYFINTISSASNRQIEQNGVFRVISPRLGGTSVKAQALVNFLGGHGTTFSVVNGSGRFAGFGKTPRARLLKALKLRKRNGSL